MVNNAEKELKEIIDGIANEKLAGRATILIKAAAFDAMVEGDVNSVIKLTLGAATVAQGVKDKVKYLDFLLNMIESDVFRSSSVGVCIAQLLNMLPREDQTRILEALRPEHSKIVAMVSFILESAKPSKVEKFVNIWFYPDSSCVYRYRYGNNCHTDLDIEFTTGETIHTYKDVPYAVFNDFHTASSKGKYYNLGIKGEYESVTEKED